MITRLEDITFEQYHYYLNYESVEDKLFALFKCTITDEHIMAVATYYSHILDFESELMQAYLAKAKAEANEYDVANAPFGRFVAILNAASKITEKNSIEDSYQLMLTVARNFIGEPEHAYDYLLTLELLAKWKAVREQFKWAFETDNTPNQYKGYQPKYPSTGMAGSNILFRLAGGCSIKMAQISEQQTIFVLDVYQLAKVAEANEIDYTYYRMNIDAQLANSRR